MKTHLHTYLNHCQNHEAGEYLSEQTKIDLDLDHVFERIDRTKSTVGRQYLYSRIHKTLSSEKERFDYSGITFSSKVSDALVELYREAGYRIFRYLDPEKLRLEKWYRYVLYTPLITIGLILLSFFHWLPAYTLLAQAILNAILYLKHKNDIYEIKSDLLEIQRLSKAGRICLSEISRPDAELEKAVKEIENLNKHTWVFRTVDYFQSDLLVLIWFPVELLNGLFLIEYRKLIRIKLLLKSRTTELGKTIRLVSKVDFAIRNQELFKTEKIICKPEFNSENTVSSENMVHPLLRKAVSNTFSTARKSMVISGSNMSGKTTFIRSIAINSILARTLNLCFAQCFSLPQGSIYTSFRVSDDLLQDKSYYQKEVETIKNVVMSANKGSLIFLDEIFKGTNRRERLAIAKATLSYLVAKGAVVFVTTHDTELNDMLSGSYEPYYFEEVVINDLVDFDYRLKKGINKQSNALRILEFYDFPDELIKEAKALSAEII